MCNINLEEYFKANVPGFTNMSCGEGRTMVRKDKLFYTGEGCPTGHCCEGALLAQPLCSCIRTFTGPACRDPVTEELSESKLGRGVADFNALASTLFMGALAILLLALLAFIFIKSARRGKRLVLVEEAEIIREESTASGSSADIDTVMEEEEEEEGRREESVDHRAEEGRRLLIRSRKGRYRPSHSTRSYARHTLHRSHSAGHNNRVTMRSSRKAPMITQMSAPPCWTCSMHQIQLQQQHIQQLIQLGLQKQQQQQTVSMDEVEQTLDSVKSTPARLITPTSASPAFRRRFDPQISSPGLVSADHVTSFSAFPSLNGHSCEAVGVATQLSVLSKSSSTTPTTPTCGITSTTSQTYM